MSFLEQIKAYLRKTPLYRPLKTLGALAGYGSYGLPFAHTVAAEPFLERAIARLGPPSLDNKNGEFYSYFSEIWGDGYERALYDQYGAYLPYIAHLRNGAFLDIGCGAGEFVAFLRDHGILAEGIDPETREVERAQALDRVVQQDDAISYLEASEKQFDGISMLEVIEHLTPEEINELIPLIFQRLAPGGVFLVETINIKHPLAFHVFYTDPTHRRPLPSDWLAFLLQWHGFTNLQIVYTSPLAVTLAESHDPSRAYFNYAIIAQKPGEPGVNP
ncbi:MAG: class I SAM-dependent methyltransferase [Acidithiobacillus sp.]